MNPQVTEEDLVRIRSLYLRAAPAQYVYWRENEALVVEKFPELVKSVAACDASVAKLISKMRKLTQLIEEKQG